MVTSNIEPSSRVMRAKAPFELLLLDFLPPFVGVSVSAAVAVFVSAGIFTIVLLCYSVFEFFYLFFFDFIKELFSLQEDFEMQIEFINIGWLS